MHLGSGIEGSKNVQRTQMNETKIKQMSNFLFFVRMIHIPTEWETKNNEENNEKKSIKQKKKLRRTSYSDVGLFFPRVFFSLESINVSLYWH